MMMKIFDIYWLDNMLNADYPAIIKNWAFPLIVGLLSLSMPLLINSIHKVEEKYRRHEVGKLVLDDCKIRWYKWSIIVVIVALVVYLLQIPRRVEWGYVWNKVIDHSAEILLILATFSFLLSVLALTRFMLKHTVNAYELYHYYRKYIGKYFKAASKLNDWDYDKSIAEKYKLRTLMAIIENVFEEQASISPDEIFSDFKDAVNDYRIQRSVSKSEKRHITIDYPDTLRQRLITLTQASFRKGDEGMQGRVLELIQTILLDKSSRYGVIPKYGLSKSTLETLWRILIDAIDQRQTEFVKMYWKKILEYTGDMFYAREVLNTIEEEQRNVNEEQYELTEEDKYERDLITYVHFMLQAYLYENKEYETLKYILEYNNSYREVKCLNFLYIENAVRAYYKVGLVDRGNPNQLIQLYKFSYSSQPSISDHEKQETILANYIVFLANYHYNATGDIPVCTSGIVNRPEIEFPQLYNAFKSSHELPKIRIYKIKVNKSMGEDEYSMFINSLKARDEQEENIFLTNTQECHLNVDQLYRSIKCTLSYEISHHIFVWTNYSEIVNNAGNTQAYESDVDCSMIIPKSQMIYEDTQRILDRTGFDIAHQFLQKMNEFVTVSMYATQNEIRPSILEAEELIRTIQEASKDMRILFFYTQNESPKKLAQKINYLYEDDRDYISPKNHVSRKSIKCVRLSDSGPAKKLENQIWILPHMKQPVAKFVEIDDKEKWESIHRYGRKAMDNIEQWFADIPIYLHRENITGSSSEPMTKISLKCKMQVIGLKDMNATQYILADFALKKPEQHSRKM